MSTRTKLFTAFGLAALLALAPAQVSWGGPSCPGRTVNIPACPAPTTTAPTTTVAPTTVALTTAAPTTAAPTTEAPAISAPATVAPPTVEDTTVLGTAVPPTEVTVVTVKAARSTLPSTGTSPVTVMVVSGLLLAVGAAIVLATRRRAGA